MNPTLQLALENAVLVAIAAPLVWLCSRLLRRPALTHALWLILLLKLITPPIYRPALPLVSSIARQPTQQIIEIASPALHPAPSEAPQATSVESDPANSAFDAETSPLPIAAHPIPQAHRSRASALIFPTIQIVWLTGLAVILAIAIWRMLRFSHGLRDAIPAPTDLQLRVARLGSRLNLDFVPKLYFIPASLCPMLWAVGRSPRLLIPSVLWARLDSSERDSIILHELAHFRRRDHWVRWIELAATAAYWWHPVCWWARRELREAEEHCCDAWVLHATGDFRPYANALLRAVEFVSMQMSFPTHAKSLPMLASGMGQFNHLKRRIVMLKNANVMRALSPRTTLAVLGFSAMLLPLSPSLTAADAPSADKPTATTPATTSASQIAIVATTPSSDEVTQVPTTTTATIAVTNKSPVTISTSSDDNVTVTQVRAALDRVQAIGEKSSDARLDDLSTPRPDEASVEQKLRAAQDRIKKLTEKLAAEESLIAILKAQGVRDLKEHPVSNYNGPALYQGGQLQGGQQPQAGKQQSGQQQGGRQQSGQQQNGQQQQGGQQQSGQQQIGQQQPQGEHNPYSSQRFDGTSIRLDSKSADAASGESVRVERSVNNEGYRAVITDDATGRVKETRELSLTPAKPADRAEHLDRLEVQLKQLLREIQSIRDQSNPSDSGSASQRR